MFQSPDNQEGSDWRDEDEKLPGHENLTEKDIELFRHIQELALQVHSWRQNIKCLLNLLNEQIRDDGKGGHEEGSHCRVRQHQQGSKGETCEAITEAAMLESLDVMVM